MRTTSIILLSFLASIVAANCARAESKAPMVRYDGTWESLQEMPIPDWFEDGKIGIFIHWGPYSVLGVRQGDRGYAEHVGTMIYKEPDYYYPILKERFGAHPPEFGYKDVVAEFGAEKWDPEVWAALFAEVGAKYVVMTAEHHDGFANWDSALTPWNAMDKGPKRDLVGELGTALKERGLKFAPSYHRERHPGFFAKDLFTVYTEPLDDIAEEIERNPEAASLYGPFAIDKDFVDDYVARWQEIQRKYEPDFLWIDDVPIFTRDGNGSQQSPPFFRPEIQYFYDQLRLMITDFMNTAGERGQAVYLNNKGRNRNWPAGIGCLEKDNLKLDGIGPKWESCTTFGTSYGYLAAEEADDYPHRKRTAEEVIHTLVETVSRNGNFLVNIGPRGDGTIPEWQVERLRAMGDWLKINGEAIYGTRYWRVHAQENEHLVFTAKADKVYAIRMVKPTMTFVIEAFAGCDPSLIQDVRLLGTTAMVRWRMTPEGLALRAPRRGGSSEHAWAFEILTTENQIELKDMLPDTVESLESH